MDTPALQQLLDDIKAEIAAGHKIAAIKLYRDATGAGLAEAKEAVELIEAGKPPKAVDRPPQPDEPAPQRVSAAISAGNLIEAIRLYRTATGVGLKEAKEAVDALAMQLNPATVTVRAAAMRRVQGLALAAVLVVVAVAVLIVVVLTRS
jgi:ribosomal protein L7/L12